METTKKLGPVIAAYPARPRSKSYAVILLLAGILLFLSSLGYGLYRAYYGYTNFGIAAAISWSWPWLLAALIILPTVTILLLPPLFSKSGSITVYKNGLVINNSRNLFNRSSPLSHVPWEKLAGITVDTILVKTPGTKKPGTRHQAGLHFTSGKHLILKDYGSGGWVINSLPELISYIKAGYYPRLLPALQTDFSAGSWLQFGPISVHPLALRINYGDTPIPQLTWSQVKRITVECGELVVELIQPGNRPARKVVPVAQIPNIELMLQIINSCAKG